MKRHAIFWLLGWSLGGGLWSACYLNTPLPRNNPFDDKFQSSFQCAQDSDCTLVGFCIDGTCKQCRNDDDCGEKSTCQDGICGDCRTTEDCPKGLTCKEGRCQACTSNLECPGGTFCQNQRCSPCESEEDGTCILSGTIQEDTQLTPNVRWLLRGTVRVEKDSTTLSIEPGTTILGESKSKGTLVIAPGANLDASGTRQNPILFTSDQAEGKRAPGDWGGIVLQGRSPVNRCDKTPCQSNDPDQLGTYGGTDEKGGERTLRYARIEFAGKSLGRLTRAGLTLQGLGTQPTLESLQIHRSGGHGIAIYGGLAQLRQVVITGMGQNGLYWTDGWRGKAQSIIVQQHKDSGFHGLHGENQAKDANATPRSKPTLSHMTLIGHRNSKQEGYGLLLSQGSGALVYSSILIGWSKACIQIGDKETFTNASKSNGKLSGELILSHCMLECNINFIEAPNTPFRMEDFVKKLNLGNRLIDPLLIDPYNTNLPNFLPKEESKANSGSQIPQDSFFEKLQHIGGVSAKKNWLQDWTSYPPN